MAIILALAGCADTAKKGTGPRVDDGDNTGDVVAGGDMAGDVDGAIPEKGRLDSIDGFKYGEFQAVHFDYDSATIRATDRKILETVAKFLKDHPEKKLLVAGNCDERGTTEYNLALGQRRASAARNYLVKLGASADHVGTVSWGEEKPANNGHNEAAWSENRRDEFGIGE